MKSTIRIPDTIKVGYQNRGGTYTGKLAYIIYYDIKGKLRKQASWDGWRHKEIEPNDYNNEPMSGFVLNKKAGGYSTGWNHRNTYVRVYDPRGFEFEISVPNLLFILENTNSIKGKGLEGEFVYGWDGKDLVLIPCNSPDYKSISELTEKMKANNYVGKDMIIGATYLTKDNEEVVYMGRYNYHGEYKRKKSYFFYDRKGIVYREGQKKWQGRFFEKGGVGGYIVDIVSDVCVSDYADIFDMFEYYECYNPYDATKDEYINHTLESFTKYVYSEKTPIRNYGNRSYCSSVIYYAMGNSEGREEEYSYHVYNKVSEVRYITVSYKVKFDYIKDRFLYEEATYIEVDGGVFYGKKQKKIVSEKEYTIEEFFYKINPQYKKEYLADGKLRKVKYNESK